MLANLRTLPAGQFSGVPVCCSSFFVVSHLLALCWVAPFGVRNHRVTLGVQGWRKREGVKVPEGELSRSGYGKCVWFMLV